MIAGAQQQFPGHRFTLIAGLTRTMIASRSARAGRAPH